MMMMMMMMLTTSNDDDHNDTVDQHDCDYPSRSLSERHSLASRTNEQTHLVGFVVVVVVVSTPWTTISSTSSELMENMVS